MMLSRRTFLRGSIVGVSALAARRHVPAWAQGAAPAVVTSEARRPRLPSGVQSGDVIAEPVIVWSRADRPSRMIVEWAANERFWVTADVHYASATRYDPSRARFSDFTPFWEFVAGPINAGTFGPGEIDKTFGPEVRYQSVAPGMKQNRPPAEGKQYYGMAVIDGATDVLTVSLHDLIGTALFTVDLTPERG